MTETFAGILVAVAIIFISIYLQKYISIRLFAATILIAIAFIYVGFSLKGNPVHLIALEVTVALIFYFLAVIGYSRNKALIAFGIILHGVWDIFHHGSFVIGTDIPGYWPTFCLTVDIIDGIWFLLIFKGLIKLSHDGKYSSR